ncbi:hypothetical protein ACF0H5_006008 [Mactra antiquata]
MVRYFNNENVCSQVYKEEVLQILRANRVHPTRWLDLIEDIDIDIDMLPEQTRLLYRNATDQQLKDPMSVKLGKLAMEEQITT